MRKIFKITIFAFLLLIFVLPKYVESAEWDIVNTVDLDNISFLLPMIAGLDEEGFTPVGSWYFVEEEGDWLYVFRAPANGQSYIEKRRKSDLSLAGGWTFDAGMTIFDYEIDENYIYVIGVNATTFDLPGRGPLYVSKINKSNGLPQVYKENAGPYGGGYDPVVININFPHYNKLSSDENFLYFSGVTFDNDSWQTGDWIIGRLNKSDLKIGSGWVKTDLLVYDTSLIFSIVDDLTVYNGELYAFGMNELGPSGEYAKYMIDRRDVSGTSNWNMGFTSVPMCCAKYAFDGNNLYIENYLGTETKKFDIITKQELPYDTWPSPVFEGDYYYKQSRKTYYEENSMQGDFGWRIDKFHKDDLNTSVSFLEENPHVSGAAGSEDVIQRMVYDDSAIYIIEKCVGCSKMRLRKIEKEAPAYIDIGLKVYNGTETVSIACESGEASPLRISKGGITYGIVLVDPGDSADSGVHIRVNGATKALRKM